VSEIVSRQISTLHTVVADILPAVERSRWYYRFRTKVIRHCLLRQSAFPAFLGNIGDEIVMNTLDLTTRVLGVTHVAYGCNTTVLTPHLGLWHV
jgi:hypothetical protein